HKDGSWRLLSWTSAPGEGGLMFATGRDITEYRQAELQVARSTKELADFKAALDNHAIVAVTDVRGTITYANDKFCAISKYAREELIGQSHRIINSGYQTKDFFREMWQTISSGQVWQGEIRNRAKDDAFYWVASTIVPFLDERGKPVQYIAIRTDITERKRVEQAIDSAREAAEMANRAKDSFLAVMSHEIRTPLGGMIGMLELLDYTPLNDDQRDTLQTTMDASQSLLRIVNDILDWSKIEAGKLELAPQVTSITQLVAGVVNTYARVASAKSLILEQYVDARISPAHLVDPLRLSQVLNNFVSNALKFTLKGRIQVRVELLDRQGGIEQMCFSVQDTGIGIEEEVRQRLFQSYSQESAETARMYGGTGLGLAICRSLATMLNGQIDLESTPGLGSTFSLTLSLPVSATAVKPAPKIPANTALVQNRNFSIVQADAPVVLVVDDDPINRKLMVIQLGLLGLRAQSVENGEAALAQWRNDRFALVITDCHMPKMDGYEFARAIRNIEASEARSRMPVFGWSANALEEEVERCRAAGMDELLVKPVGLTQLGEVLSRWLKAAAPTRPARTGHRQRDDAQAASADFTVLDELSDNPADKMEILLNFMSQTRSDFAELEAAVAMWDFQASMRIAHRMKGASRVVGAREMAAACEAMEHAMRQGKPASTSTIKAALLRLESHLAGVMGGNQDERTGNGQ
ncbi:MAG: ATP-binding protein, partial [Candidatus Nitrotoga sp.]